MRCPLWFCSMKHRSGLGAKILGNGFVLWDNTSIQLMCFIHEGYWVGLYQMCDPYIGAPESPTHLDAT